MQDFDFLADERLADALLAEIAGLLETLITENLPGAIDLLGLPLPASCIALCKQKLGQGEVTATLTASGKSEFYETRFPGVWWSSHADETGRIAALLIEVTAMPEILLAKRADMQGGHRRLLEAAVSQNRQTA